MVRTQGRSRPRSGFDDEHVARCTSVSPQPPRASDAPPKRCTRCCGHADRFCRRRGPAGQSAIPESMDTVHRSRKRSARRVPSPLLNRLGHLSRGGSRILFDDNGVAKLEDFSVGHARVRHVRVDAGCTWKPGPAANPRRSSRNTARGRCRKSGCFIVACEWCQLAKCCKQRVRDDLTGFGVAGDDGRRKARAQHGAVGNADFDGCRQPALSGMGTPARRGRRRARRRVSREPGR